MTRKEIVDKLTMIFHEVFNDDSIVLYDGMTADDVDRWDSFSHMLMISRVEDIFNIKFKLRELNKMNNVGDLVSVIELKMSCIG